ncbi:M23 family metallopeptidase [Flaviaesturariibacter terrae]
MKQAFLLLFLIQAIAAAAQPRAKVSSERVGDSIVLYASNPEWYPVSLLFKMENTNLAFSEGSRMQFLVPSHSDKFRIGVLSAARPGKSYAMKFSYRIAMGDVTAHPSDTTYLLPFSKGEQYRLHQGYNGNFSHQGEYALDFSMPEGTQLRAVRGGTVVDVVQSNDRHCADPSCKQFNNNITILHADGTFGYYAHIRQNGAQVKPGDVVQAGDPIALSGNVGFTDGPHLHFALITGSYEGWKTWPGSFRTDAGSVRLKEGVTYTRSY